MAATAKNFDLFTAVISVKRLNMCAALSPVYQAEVVPLLRRNVTMNLGGNTANSCDNCHDGGGNESKGTAASKRPKIEVKLPPWHFVLEYSII